MTMAGNRLYGKFHKYIRQAAKGKVNPKDFKDVDANVMRQLLDDYSRSKGPLMSFDWRWFNWMYVFFITYLAWSYYQMTKQQESIRAASGNSTLSERRRMYDGDYEEDLRYSAGPARGALSPKSRL